MTFSSWDSEHVTTSKTVQLLHYIYFVNSTSQYVIESLHS